MKKIASSGTRRSSGAPPRHEAGQRCSSKGVERVAAGCATCARAEPGQNGPLEAGLRRFSVAASSSMNVMRAVRGNEKHAEREERGDDP